VACGDLNFAERYAGVEGRHKNAALSMCGCTCPIPARLPMERTQRWAVRRSRR
jgi:hypothetical protein